jgi:S-adenosylmethionine:tRNA ribosyltransferase-isomerase
MPHFPFDYDLPASLIAQEPVEPRDQARLLVVRRESRAIEHRHFFDLPDLLRPGDLLVLNDTRVLHARLLGRRAATGGKWEGLFLRAHADGTWEMLCQTRGTLKPGEVIDVEPGPFALKLLDRLPDGRWRVEPQPAGDPAGLLERFGQVPLPPYIRKGTARPADRERYQTVYARRAGAVAAPTAGLHFTPRVFDQLKRRGIGWAFVTLHVGLGTFRPVEVEDYTRHEMHREWGELSAATADAIRACKDRGGRVVAVGTTSVRVLESAARAGAIQSWSGETDLYIYPPYEYRVVDALVTNFHLPRTTLLLLVAALAGADLLRRAYETAVAQRYRFFSYGDAMLIARTPHHPGIDHADL